MAKGVTVKQASDILGLKVRTIREWIGTGRLPAIKKGRSLFIPIDVIYSKEVQERADKGREHSRRIKESRAVGMLAGRSEDSNEPI